MERSRTLLGTFAVVNFTDYVTTVKGIEMGFRELNQFVASLNPASFLLFKTAIILTILLLVVYSRKLPFPFGRGVHLGLAAGVIISTAFLGICSVHNFLLLIGCQEVEGVVRLMSAVLALT